MEIRCMTSRREFLQTGVAVSTLPFAGPALGAIRTSDHSSVPLYAVIYDTRFEPSVAFARRSAALGLSTREIAGDMTTVWYNDLYHRWKQSPIAIAGLTNRGALFCFEQLGRDQGLRIRFRSEHRPRADGTIEHTLTGPAPMLAAASRITSPASVLGDCLAEIVSGCPDTAVTVSSASFRSHGSLGLSGDDDALYSWVLAPANRPG
jgi:hypothetical protein